MPSKFHKSMKGVGGLHKSHQGSRHHIKPIKHVQHVKIGGHHHKGKTK